MELNRHVELYRNFELKCYNAIAKIAVRFLWWLITLCFKRASSSISREFFNSSHNVCCGITVSVLFAESMEILHVIKPSDIHMLNSRDPSLYTCCWPGSMSNL